jgi:hypothetical protein
VPRRRSPEPRKLSRHGQQPWVSWFDSESAKVCRAVRLLAWAVLGNKGNNDPAPGGVRRADHLTQSPKVRRIRRSCPRQQQGKTVCPAARPRNGVGPPAASISRLSKASRKKRSLLEWNFDGSTSHHRFNLQPPVRQRCSAAGCRGKERHKVRCTLRMGTAAKKPLTARRPEVAEDGGMKGLPPDCRAESLRCPPPRVWSRRKAIGMLKCDK